MKDLAGFSKEQVDVGRLAQVIREKGRPVGVNVLAREAVREFLMRHGERQHAPGARYAPGERILLDGEPVEVRAARQGGNPGQGDFTVLTLSWADGSERWMAAEVTGAPAQDRYVTEDQIRSQMKGKAGDRIRAAVKAALDKDARFVSFQFARGNTCCLREMLPAVGKAELKKVSAVLSFGQEGGEEPKSESTETLVRVVWGIENDGSTRYELAEFALSRALKQCADVQNVSGNLWGWKAAWDAFFAPRGRMPSPREPTSIVVPEGITQKVTDSSHDQGTPIRIEVSMPEEEKDLEAWHDDHPTMGAFTLSASQYYKAWLPLKKDLRNLFPPLEAGKQKIVLRLNLLGHRESMPAWVDMYKGQILGKKQLYEALHEQGVYPGARLRLAFVQVGEYELATKPPTMSEPVRVWRIWLKDGEVKGEPFEEKRRYDIDDEVFVADARFEDMEALFQQAEDRLNSIFGLMYEKCKEWWEALRRAELRVTAERLFEAIHTEIEQGRMTSLATVAWELWRREAFEPLGGGVYRFRPERGKAVRMAARVYWARHSSTKARPKVADTQVLGHTLAEDVAEIEPEVEVEAATQQLHIDEVQPGEMAPQFAPTVSEPGVAAPEPVAVEPEAEAAAQQPAVREPQVEEGTSPAEEIIVETDTEGPASEAAVEQPDVMAPEPEAMMRESAAPASEPEVAESEVGAGASPVEETAPKASLEEPKPEAVVQQPDAPASEPEVVEPQFEITAPQPAVRGEGAHVAEEKAQAEKAGVDAGAGRTQSQRAEPRHAVETPKEPSARGDGGKAPEAAARQQKRRKQRSSRSRRPRGQGQRIWDTFMELPPVRWLRRLIGRK